MAKDFDNMENSNDSDNLEFNSVSKLNRRTILKYGTSLGSMGILAPLLAACAQSNSLTKATPTLGFKSIPVDTKDRVVVPDGYVATALAQWGEPIGIVGNMPAYKIDGSNSAEDQAVQMGMHHDGLHFYALEKVGRGLLVMNHEYVDDGLLHVGGMKEWTADKVKKSQNAHGIAVIEVEQMGGKWNMVRPSKYARRITAHTPFSIGGPASGHVMMRTAADPNGASILGTINNCASGKTPWGTYLSGEENFAYYFGGVDKPTPHQMRWGLRKEAFFGWDKHDDRFNTDKNPNEYNRFGWIVEVDPMDPTSTPVKRTALGRAAHEGAWVAVTKDNRAVVYSGEDARFEYIYKFVSRDTIKPAGNGLTQAQANKELLDFGTLYVARFDADGTGVWLPLVQGQGPLTAANGFVDQGEVVIKARQASDALGATKMDRPEWLAINHATGEVYATLTNNSQRGEVGKPGVDAANPRVNNVMGNIIRWKDTKDFSDTQFTWNHFVMAGDPEQTRAEAKGNIKGEPKDVIFACPDGLAFAPNGVLWIQTDMHASQMYKGELINMGNNQMLACNPQTGEVRRFLTGPTNCEITGCTWAPDGRTMFINIQHPGENAADRSDPEQPAKFSNWPDYSPGGRPRSSTVVIRKLDGGIIGS